MSRLPIPGQDSGTWGDVLNDYLSQSHAVDGTLKPGVVGSTQLTTNSVTATTIANGTITEAQLTPALQTKIDSSTGAYVKPGSGIPDSDLTIVTQRQLASDHIRSAMGMALFDSFTALPDGTNPSRALTGQAWTITGNTPVVASGTFDTAAGTGQMATYLEPTGGMGAPVKRIGAIFQFDSHSGALTGINGTLCLRVGADTGINTTPFPNRVAAHCSTTKDYWTYFVRSTAGGSPTTLFTHTYATPLVPGVSYAIQIKIVGDKAFVTGPDGVTVMIQDNRIALDCMYPNWEPFYIDAANDWRMKLTHVWADTSGSSDGIGQAWTAADHGLISWNFDPASISTANTVTAGQLYLVGVKVPLATTITNVVMAVFAAGATLTSGQNFAALFDSTGKLLSATADQTTAWGSVGLKTMALATPQAVTAGVYYVGFYANGTTTPTFSGCSLSYPMTMPVRGGTNVRNALGSTGLTTAMPSTTGVTSGLASRSPWVAVS